MDSFTSWEAVGEQATVQSFPLQAAMIHQQISLVSEVFPLVTCSQIPNMNLISKSLSYFAINQAAMRALASHLRAFLINQNWSGSVTKRQLKDLILVVAGGVRFRRRCAFPEVMWQSFGGQRLHVQCCTNKTGNFASLWYVGIMIYNFWPRSICKCCW